MPMYPKHSFDLRRNVNVFNWRQYWLVSPWNAILIHWFSINNIRQLLVRYYFMFIWWFLVKGIIGAKKYNVIFQRLLNLQFSAGLNVVHCCSSRFFVTRLRMLWYHLLLIHHLFYGEGNHPVISRIHWYINWNTRISWE
jgi:hypothetical protein